MIDFGSIRPHRGSQNNAFEELVCQLVRRRPPPDAKEFRRIEGAGGDGGVEAVWLRNDGAATGIQAKYFLRVRDIDWTQIDKSVSTTLEQRGDVDLYLVAIACDLTDTSGKKGLGRTGWRAWDERVKRWQDEARSLGREVTFQPITRSELIDWLLQPTAAGLAQYWFGSYVLGPSWFEDQIARACADLGERFTPEHHVEVSASLAFDGLARSRGFRGRLLGALETTKRNRIKTGSLTLPEPVRAAADGAIRALEEVYAIVDHIPDSVEKDWPIHQWLSRTRVAESALERLDEETRRQEHKARASGKESASALNQSRFVRHSTGRALEALYALLRLLESDAFRADASRVLLLTGEAGTGKSHLLAAEARRSLAEGRAALLFLGQQFAQGHLWDQIERSLGLGGWRRDDFLGALDAAGEAAGCRVLVLVDAVNEGAGANLWRSSMAGFIETVSKYSNIAVSIACRSEYVSFTIPKQVLQLYPRVNLRGFATFEEQEAAAIQYLDRRGIVRPAGPLLDPEFSHPLFLKAASDALLRQEKTAFPRGLRGALKLLNFYLDSVGASLLAGLGEPADLSRELQLALHALAAKMAATKLDHVPRSLADQIVTEAFSPRIPPTGLTWLEVLVRNGVLRLDPDPTTRLDDYFVAAHDVARIAFQRFQDHLVVQACIHGVGDAASLFEIGGVLEWIVSERNRHGATGLLEALSIQTPEFFGVELVDALPGGADRWWGEWDIEDAFKQSVRWRAIKSRKGDSAFTERTLELFNSIDEDDSISLLLELAADPTHPWNADMLHRNLWSWGLNKRDLQWSRVVAFESEEEGHAVHRLLKWAQAGKLDRAEKEVLRLVAITLTWLCSSTSRYIRDTATVALCRLIRKSPEMNHWLVKTMAEVDDSYVLERLLAASYGAACQLGDDPILEEMALTTFTFLFRDRSPPQHLLTRDYALGLIELAAARGRLPAEIDIAKAGPPFAAQELVIPTETDLEKRSKEVGGDRILWSCGEHGDFGNYEIRPAVGNFSAVELSSPAPLSKRDRFNLFVKEVVALDSERQAAFNAVELASRSIWGIELADEEDGFGVRRVRSKEAGNFASDRESAFLFLLNDDERYRYLTEAHDYLFTIGKEVDRPCFDISSAMRWITGRAYDLGWNSQIFGQDETPPQHSRQRARVERIGKKYQWIALYELLAWLGDTHWINADWGSAPKRYSYPTDVPFQRDIDPSLSADSDIRVPADDGCWKHDFLLSSIPDVEIDSWAKRDDAWQIATSSVFRTDDLGQQWVSLYSYQRAVELFPDTEDVPRQIAIRREAFQLLHCVLVSKKDLNGAYGALRTAREREISHWEPRKLTDGPYLGEFGWRATWPDDDWVRGDAFPGGISVLRPVVEYSWESHLDASRPDGAGFFLPSSGLLHLLGIAPPDPCSPDETRDIRGRAVTIHRAVEGHGNALLIRKDALDQMLAEHDLGCLWFVSAERSAWPTGKQEDSVRRWFGCLISYDGRNTRDFEWEEPW